MFCSSTWEAPRQCSHVPRLELIQTTAYDPISAIFGTMGIFNLAQPQSCCRFDVEVRCLVLRSYPTARPELQGCGAVRCGESAPLFMQATTCPDTSPLIVDKKRQPSQGGVEGGGNGLVFISKGVGWPKKKGINLTIGCLGGSKSPSGSLLNTSIFKDRCTGRRSPSRLLGTLSWRRIQGPSPFPFPGCISGVATDLELTAGRRAMCGSSFRRVSFSP
jgi:hypothetical protein